MNDAELIAFVYDEAALLDAGRFDDWLGLFAEDGRYWVPLSGVLSSAKGSDAIKGRLLAEEVSRRMADAITTGFTRP